MKHILFFLILFPIYINAQDLGNPVHAPMPIDLDKDTTYTFNLNKDYCEKDDYNLFGVTENGSCSYYLNMPHLYIAHNFSLGCCTSDFYTIKIESNNIYVSVSDTGEPCLCGLCTYYVCFYDPNPQKESYHLHMNCLDTVVSKPTAINNIIENKDDIFWTYDNSTLKVQINKLFVTDVNIKILNLSGQIIYNHVNRGNMFNIDLPSCERFYIMSIGYDGKVNNFKIIKK